MVMFLNQQHLELLKKGGATTWNTWRLSHPAAVPQLHAADLNGVDLSEYNLSMANLREANLANADLTGADLSGANFTSANLVGANLNWAHLTDTIISEEQLNSVKSRLEET